MKNNLLLIMRIIHVCVKFTANLAIILLLLVFIAIRRAFFDIPVFLINLCICEVRRYNQTKVCESRKNL